MTVTKYKITDNNLNKQHEIQRQKSTYAKDTQQKQHLGLSRERHI
jgi:hypothetical protein